MAINKRIIRSNDEAAGGASFNTVIYSGNGSTQSITGVGFEPDLVWAKRRSSAEDNVLFDSVRGVQNQLVSNKTNAESTKTNALSSFDSDGFTTGANNALNTSGQTYVAWCWKAGGAAVTNTDGDLTSQVSANTEAGFSIVNYTGNDVSGNISVGHGLGITPKIVIQKNRSISSNWEVQTTIIDGSNDFLYLNDTRAAGNASQLSPESDVFWIRKDIYVNQNNSSNQYINYCFAEVAGFSKFGSYTGNGTASLSNPIIDCGFEPAFVMIKNASSSGTGWFMFDNKRNPSNPINKFLQAHSSGAEAAGGLSTDYLQFESNGFRSTSDSPSLNGNGNTLIFMAFANQF